MTTPTESPPPMREVEMEEWRPAPGHEAFYEVSSDGRVRTAIVAAIGESING